MHSVCLVSEFIVRLMKNPVHGRTPQRSRLHSYLYLSLNRAATVTDEREAASTRGITTRAPAW